MTQYCSAGNEVALAAWKQQFWPVLPVGMMDICYMSGSIVPLHNTHWILWNSVYVHGCYACFFYN